MKMQKLLVSPIVEIKEINEQEEVGLTADEIRLISKAYNTYWKQHENNRPVKSVHQFFWEELERWGHPVYEERNDLDISDAALFFKSLRDNDKFKRNVKNLWQQNHQD